MADNRTSIILTARDEASGVLGKVGASIDKLGGSASGLASIKGALGGLTAALSVGGLVAFAKSTIDAADNINDLSQRIGIGVRDLATWQLAAEQSGTSLESVARGVKALSKNLVENGDAFRAAGITATDANGALVQLADIFAAMPDGIEKTTLAVELFGKAGMDMIPLLNQGSKGLAETQAKAAAYAEKLAELAPKADAFNDALAELGLTGKSVAIDALLPLVEGLTGLVAFFKDATSGAVGLGKALDFLAEKTDSELLGAASYLAKQAGRSGVVGGAPGVKSGWDLIPKKGTALALPGENSQAEKDAAARGRQLLASFGKKSTGTGKSGAAFDPSDAGFDMAKQAADEWDKLNKEKERAGKANEKLVEQYRQMADPLRKYFQQLEEINKLEGVGAEEKARFSSAVQASMDAEIAKMVELGDVVQETDGFAQSLGLTFASAFEDAIVEGKEFSEVIKGLAKDIERMIVRKTITEPLGNAIGGMLEGFDAGSMLKGLFGGGRASGGPVSAGKFYVVGENGPELLMPGSSGTVLPNAAMAGGGGGITITQNINIDSRSDAATIRMAMIQAKQETLAAIGNAQRRGG